MTSTASFVHRRPVRTVAILALAALTFVSASTARATCGDVTGDSDIKATDALNVLKAAVKIYTESDLDCSCGAGTTSALSVLGPSGA